MSNPPFTGLEPLRPLCGAAVLYLVFLVLLRLLVWPRVGRVRGTSPLRRYVSRIVSLLVYLGFVGLLILATLFGFAALTGGDLVVNVDLEQFQPDNISPRLALLVLVGLLGLALLIPSRRRGRR